MVLEEVERQIERVDSFRESVMRATHESIRQFELERAAHKKMMRQIERVDSFRESVMRATHESIRQFELERAAHKKMMRQIERVDSSRESVMRATHESIRQFELERAAHEKMMRQIERMDSSREKVRREAELMLPDVLEYAKRKKTKSTTRNVSYYCREWDWELYVLTDPLWEVKDNEQDNSEI